MRTGRLIRHARLGYEGLAVMAQPDASRLHQLAEDVARQEFSIPIARTMKLQEIQEAHRIFERG
jgi:hypothetical protein